MFKRLIFLLLIAAAFIVNAETVKSDSGKVETQATLVDPFTLEETTVEVEVSNTELILTTQENGSGDYHGSVSFFEWVQPNNNASKSMVVSDGSGNWSWHRPIIVPGRPHHRSPFSPDQEY